MLYCLKCGVWAYKNHKCNIMSLIPITRDMCGIADRLHSLGLELMSAGCFTHPVKDSFYEHKIIIDIEFKRQYPTTILGGLPTGWVWYTQTVSSDHLSLMALSYSETYVWLGETVEERIKQITEEFETYLDTMIDKDGFKAVLTLMDS